MFPIISLHLVTITVKMVLVFTLGVMLHVIAVYRARVHRVARGLRPPLV